MRNILLFLFMITQSLLAQQRNYDTLPNSPEHYVKRMAAFNKQPIIAEKVIMLGNSITEGGDWKKLLADTTIINRGISGDVTFGVLNRLDDITKRKPSKVFLLIGINDLSRNTPTEVIIENIFNIAYRIRATSPKTQLFVQSILPLNESFQNFPKQFKGKQEQVIHINAQLSKYAEKMKYTYVDLSSKFTDKDGNIEAKYATDGLHLTALGYQNWSSILKPYLKK
jgi:lysophospholipase L1-like esterase